MILLIPIIFGLLGYLWWLAVKDAPTTPYPEDLYSKVSMYGIKAPTQSWESSTVTDTYYEDDPVKGYQLKRLLLKKQRLRR